MKKVFIVGSEGTTGLRLKGRLLTRDDIKLITIKETLRKDNDEILRLMELSDFCFLCLPDAAAREIAKLSKELETKIIDTSTAHRTDSLWAYGFPELSDKYRQDISASSRVASPGCHASGFIALVKPLVDNGVLPPDTPLSCMSLTGYSGGGKKMIAEYQAVGRGSEYKSPYLYAMSQQHKHLPEMSKHAGVPSPVFMPVVGDFYSGMAVSIPLNTNELSLKPSCDDLRDIYDKTYSSSKLVHVSKEEPAAIYASSMSGRDDMEIFVTGSNGRFLLTAVFDNLGKGASGAAIECFNIMCGLPDETGLVCG